MPVLLVAFTLLISLAIINPFRETLGNDDAWVYALMARYTLATGRYHIHPFTVVNLPVQIYIAAGLSKFFGYSLILLRCITLVFLFLALGCFYLISREFGHPRQWAAFVTLVFLACPTVLILSLAFMSDIQFLGWLFLALLLYLRGFRQQSVRTMFLGSIAAACAIGTRQFGLVLLLGLAACWVFSPRARRPSFRLIASAGILPLLAGLIQIYVGVKYPDATQKACMVGMHAFLRSSILVLAREYFWRCCMILQYVGMGLLPLAPFLFAGRRSFLKGRIGRLPIWAIGLLTCIAICVALYSSSVYSARPIARHRGLWVPLELEWILPSTLTPLSVMRLLDISGIIGAGALVILFADKLKFVARTRTLSPETLLFLGTALGFLMMYLFFTRLNDTYIIDLLPFVLLLIADLLRRLPSSARLMRASTVISVTLIIILGFWLRAVYARDEAGWKSAEVLYHSGVQPIDIYAPYQWSMYHGAYDEWVATAPTVDFDDWLYQRMLEKRYRIWSYPVPVAPTGWKLLAARSYRNFLFRKRFVLTLESDTAFSSLP